MDIFVVETRSIAIAQEKEIYLSCDYVYMASTSDRAEDWILTQNPSGNDRYYYAIIKVKVDSNVNFELIGYYNILGEKTTKDRCIESLKLPRAA